MGHLIVHIRDEASWHKERGKGIGGSDAACVLGLSPYKSNVDLWREKTGRKQPEDISDKPAVKYGKDAEEHLRGIFILDYPQYALNYSPYDLHINEKHQFIKATLDGELTHLTTQTKGILEIKTSTILKQNDWEKWDNKIPMNYFCQVLHYFLIDEDYKFCKLKAQLKYTNPNDQEVRATTRHYHILRDNHIKDLEELKEAEIKFWHYVENDIEPPLMLPNI